MKKETTVTIAVCAFNEGKNIKNFLASVLSQKSKGFTIAKIAVYSDGSTDDTVKVVKTFRNKGVRLIEGKKRLGKSQRLNQIYEDLDSDILVQFDADIILAGKYVVRDLIRPIIKQKNVGMVGGNCIPVNIETFVQKAVACTYFAYYPLRKAWKGGNSYLSVAGQILAFKKDLVKMIEVPKNSSGNDDFTYFSCLENGFKYRYVPTAKIFFTFPRTLQDQIKQNTRFNTVPIKMKRYFDTKLVNKEYTIPTNLILPMKLKQFLKHPVLCLYIVIINFYCKLSARFREKNITSLWEIASTTKQVFPVN